MIHSNPDKYKKEAAMFGCEPGLPKLSDILGKLREPDRVALEDFYEQASEIPGVFSIKLKNPRLDLGNLPKKYHGLEVVVLVHPCSGSNDCKQEAFLRDYCRSSKHYHFGERDELRVPTSAKIQYVWKLNPRGEEAPVEIGFYESMN